MTYGKATLNMNEVSVILNSKDIQRRASAKDDSKFYLLFIRGRNSKLIKGVGSEKDTTPSFFSLWVCGW